jgi:hypothetical protein
MDFKNDFIDPKTPFEIGLCIVISLAFLVWATWYFVTGGWPCHW